MNKILIIHIFFYLLFCCGCKTESEVFFTSTESESISSDYIVEIKGAVRIPGIYYIDSNAMIKDIIMISGGLLESADVTTINLVSPIHNNQMIYIPFKDDVSTDENTKININIASKSELMKLNGIGEAKANSIIEYRNNNGLFIIIDDIMNVSGIGEEVFNKIKTDITVS